MFRCIRRAPWSRLQSVERLADALSWTLGVARPAAGARGPRARRRLGPRAAAQRGAFRVEHPAGCARQVLVVDDVITTVRPRGVPRHLRKAGARPVGVALARAQ
jgi:predicted amidophosphoribosyltransferase